MFVIINHLRVLCSAADGPGSAANIADANSGWGFDQVYGGSHDPNARADTDANPRSDGIFGIFGIKVSLDRPGGDIRTRERFRG